MANILGSLIFQTYESLQQKIGVLHMGFHLISIRKDNTRGWGEGMDYK